MRALVPEKSKIRNQSYTYGSTSEKDKSLEVSREVEIENSNKKELISGKDQKKITSSSTATQMKKFDELSSKTLAIESGLGSQYMRSPLTSVPVVGEVAVTNVASKVEVKAQREQGLLTIEPTDKLNNRDPIVITELSSSQPVASDMIIFPKKKSNRKWKRSAREVLAHQQPVLVSSPIQRVLAIGKPGKKISKCVSSSPPGPQITGRIGKVKSPTKGIRQSKLSPKVEGHIPHSQKEVATQSCRRKVEGSEKSISGIIRFRQAMDDCDLSDVGCSGPFLTWNNRREGKGNVQERLDRFLANTN
ncbi:hypothetical protein EZV62_001069 [Acer yangbiense]|uniref:Uncharacterized protein n=1 Tax=Acer yangbiense TaxID=1000413 RepID=A0A5C7IT31_9ROSI|nr:hypothetical protein EZV62_001069 [Acer yangbiense]